MGRYSPTELRDALGAGLLSLPVTHATADYAFDEDGYRAHLQHLDGFDVAGLFAAGGTGEFFSLTPAEVEQVTAAAVDAAAVTLNWAVATPAVVAACHRLGAAVYVWTVNDRDRAKTLVETGVDAIITDDPRIVPGGTTT